MIVLAGCTSRTLGGYLQGLGLWRALARLADPAARAQWDHTRLVLTTELAPDDLVALLRDRFEPLPIVSPWNAGSGFAANGKNPAAEKALATVRAGHDPRFAALRTAVTAADGVIAAARANGWDESRKADVLRLCRNTLPDDAIEWLDAAIVLTRNADGADEIAYSRLLGTGGNFGRLDLQNTYLQRALLVLTDARGQRNSAGWLRAALYGDETTPYLRDAVGQFDPGRAGGIQSSPAEKADDAGFANPWSFLLTIEGALLFASAATRRQGALNGRATVPFLVGASTVGFGSSAAEERALGEIWAPEWDRPATLAEISHLLGEGRAQLSGNPARSGLEFARAAATLGVDRGISRFSRHVFAERLGQSPLAVPVGVVEVRERGGARLLDQLDPWLTRLRGMTLPSALQGRLRALDEAMYSVATGGPAGLRRVVVEVGRMHEAISRSGATRERIRPLKIDEGDSWWPELQPAGPELRVAAALAGGWNGGRWDWPLRRALSPVSWSGYLMWTDTVRVATAGGALAAVAGAHRLRTIPGAVSDPAREDQQPAVRGVFSAFTRGPRTSLADLIDLVSGSFDDELFADYLRGLLLFDLSTLDRIGDHGTPELVPPALALLLPFFSPRPMRIWIDDIQKSLVLRSGSTWLPLLHAGQLSRVAEDAATRLRIAGVPGVIDPACAAAGVDPDRLAAALLVPIPVGHRIHALCSICTLPTK